MFHSEIHTFTQKIGAYDINSCSSVSSFSINCSPNYENSCLYTSSDLYYEDGSLFLPAPHLEEQSMIAISTDYSMAQAEILGILPIVLVVVIGLLALRKAIQLLLQMLHQG